MGDKPLPSTSGFIDPNFPNPHGPDDARIVIYGYTPNLALCILGIALFTISFLLHLTQLLYYRLWSFTPLTIACLMEIVGYVLRLLSSQQDPYRITYFVVQYFLIVTAPVLISASIYVCLTKILAWGEGLGVRFGGSWFLRRKVILWTFISVDVVCTVVQMTGASLIGVKTSKQMDPKIPNDILLAGLVVQCFAFLIFLIILTIIATTIIRDRGAKEEIRKKRSPFLGVLAVASLLVFIRTLFRMVETSQGVFGFLSSHEGYFGGLEFAPMVVAVWLLAVWHPGRWPTRIVGKVGRA